MQQVAAEGKGMPVVCVPQSGTVGGGLKLERGTGWEKVPCTGVAPSSKIPAFFEVASPTVCRSTVFLVRPVSYLGHLAL